MAKFYFLWSASFIPNFLKVHVDVLVKIMEFQNYISHVKKQLKSTSRFIEMNCSWKPKRDSLGFLAGHTHGVGHQALLPFPWRSESLGPRKQKRPALLGFVNLGGKA